MKSIQDMVMAQIRELDLSKRFLFLMAGLTLLTVLSTQVFYSRQQRLFLEMRLKEKAAFVNKFYSYLVAGLLVRKDDIGLLQVVNSMEEDKEITSVIVVGQKSDIRYHVDPQKIGMKLEDPMVQNVLQSGDSIEAPYKNEGGKALALVSPLKVPGMGAPIGVMRTDLTYHDIDRQMESSTNRFWFITIGSIVTCAGMVLSCLGRWVLVPLQKLRASLASVNPAQPEANLPVSSDEFGQINATGNDMIQRFKVELQQQWVQQRRREEQEKMWINQLMGSFLPGARVIIADKDNRIVSDSGSAPTPGRARHLLDLIKEANFATLLNAAFQKEGEVVRGPVQFQETAYIAAVLSVPANQSVVVKTLIALQPN